MKSGIGWGVIGCGDVVLSKSGAALRETPGSRLVGVMRRDPDKLREAAERLKASFATSRADELIAHPEVDAIYIATPPQHQLDYAQKVAAAGKPCLVEKPAGRCARELERMVEFFARAGTPLYVSYYRRHLPRFLAVRELLRRHDFGPVVGFDYRLAKPPGNATWRLSAASGGGHFHDLAGHVLDLLDDWFGPLRLTGSSVSNVLPGHEVEDAAVLCLEGAGGVIGSASWNFAASARSDELVIEGLHGRLRLAAMSTSEPIEVEYEVRNKGDENFGERLRRRLDERLGRGARRELAFEEEAIPHRPLIRRIVDDLRSGAAPASPDAALRTARIVNQALERYYGGRDDAFWEHPERFHSARARASQRNAQKLEYPLSAEELRFFEENGYLGPFRCDADWQSLEVPLKKRRNIHLTEPQVFEICTHPSIVQRAAQLLGKSQVALFKSRFVVKRPGDNEAVAWHQDVGPNNGGYYPDGSPVPSVTCWMALDKVDASNGAVQVLPGTHRELVGDFHKRISAQLIEKGVLSREEIERKAFTFALEPGEFYFFHSWLLHGSEASSVPVRRAGLNVRFVAVEDQYESKFQYLPLDCGPAAQRG